MKADVWMPLYIDDYLGDTMLLTVEQHGAYLLLLMSCWRNGGWLPANDRALAAASRLGRGWRKHRETLEAFFIVDGERWTHKRVSAEVAKAERLAEASRINGRKGGRPPNPERTQEEPAGFSPGLLSPRAANNPDRTRHETPARVEGGRSVDSDSPIQRVGSDSQVEAKPNIIPLDGRAGR